MSTVKMHVGFKKKGGGKGVKGVGEAQKEKEQACVGIKMG